VPSSLTSNGLNILLSLSFFFFALRVLYLYIHIRSARLFLFGFSMLVISFTAATDFVSGFFLFLHTDWFLFIGQAISLLFVLFSLLRTFDRHLELLIRVQLFVSALLLLLLAFSPFLPTSSTPWLFCFSAARSAICFAIFFYYLSIFFHKDTRFSLLMSLAFFLLSLGYLLTLPRYVLPDASLMDMVGDIVRVVGVLILSLSFTIS
jgi:hypothetical protein